MNEQISYGLIITIERHCPGCNKLTHHISEGVHPSRYKCRACHHRWIGHPVRCVMKDKEAGENE